MLAGARCKSGNAGITGSLCTPPTQTKMYSQILMNSQIWLNQLIKDCHFGYINREKHLHPIEEKSR